MPSMERHSKIAPSPRATPADSRMTRNTGPTCNGRQPSPIPGTPPNEPHPAHGMRLVSCSQPDGFPQLAPRARGRLAGIRPDVRHRGSRWPVALLVLAGQVPESVRADRYPGTFGQRPSTPPTSSRRLSEQTEGHGLMIKLRVGRAGPGCCWCSGRRRWA